MLKILGLFDCFDHLEDTIKNLFQLQEVQLLEAIHHAAITKRSLDEVRQVWLK